MTEAQKALARFKAITAARGCPAGLSMEEIVLAGFATMAEAEELKVAVEQELDD